MTNSETHEKRYSASYIEWNSDTEEYEYAEDVTVDGELLQFDTYAEFLEFVGGLNPDEKIMLGLWRLDDNESGDFITINDGEFDEVNFLSLRAARTEPQK
jgi:hypothetical protein